VYGIKFTIVNEGQYSYTADITEAQQTESPLFVLWSNGNQSSPAPYLNGEGDATFPTTITDGDNLGSVHVTPGSEVSGWVYFVSSDPISPTSVTFTPTDSVSDTTYDPGEWSLN